MSKNIGVHYSTGTDDWATPRPFFNRLDAEFHFTLDAAASDENRLCHHYFTETEDGLLQSWYGVVFCNPPYSSVAKWIEKAYRESLLGATVVLLIPSRTDTAAWHRFIFPHAAEIRFVRGRLKFGGSANSAPFPSAVIVFRPGHVGGPQVSTL